jgi:hypothetical protein
MICNRVRAFVSRLLLVSMLALVSACGGGGGGGGGSSGAGNSTTAPTTPTTPAAPLANFTTISVDAGPAALGTGSDPTRAVNEPYVSVTVCVPSSTTCQTIDHVLLDTGSIGLRLLKPVLNAAILAGLPNQLDTAGNPVGECYGFVDGYVFGSVRTADFKIGGATVSAMPVQVIADTGPYATAPSECTAGGGSAITTVQDLAANGVLGIGTTPTDCGVFCTRTGGFGAAIYYDCPTGGCSAIITRASSTKAPFQQLPNPIAAMATDNNGTMIVLPSVPATGSASVTGTLYFGIGTETNNQLAAANILPTTLSTSVTGSGLLTATYKGQSLPDSFVDSGSSAYFFADSAIPQCTATDDTGFYCPTAPTNLALTLAGTNGKTADASFVLYNAQTQFATGDAAVPGLGANAGSISGFMPPMKSFDVGFPFFFGRTTYTAIEGTSAGGTAGPFVAF